MFQKTNFFVKLCSIWTNFETISQSINHTKFVYCWQETFKMGVHTTKSTLTSCYKFPFLPRYFYIKKLQLSIFFLVQKRRHVWMTSIKCHQNIFVKNWFKFPWALLKPFDFEKWQHICYSRSKGRFHGHVILLFINSIKCEIRFLRSQRQKVLKLKFLYTFYNIIIPSLL